MTSRDDKGFLTGGMKFGVGDDLGPEERERGPLLPLRVLVVADLVPADAFNAGASAPNHPIRVDPARFDDLFTKLRPRIAIEVPSVLAEGRPVRVDVAPTSLKSFRPDGLCAELPLLRSLLDGRLVLDRLRDGSITVEQARAELERLWSGSPFAREVLGLIGAPAANAPSAALAPAPAAGDAQVASILDMVDLGGASSPSGSPSQPAAAAAAPAESVSKFSAIIAGVAKSARGGSAPTPVRPAEAIARVEKALGAQIGAILQHPEVRRLEQAFRGLRFLVERAGTASGVRFDVVSAPADRAAEALEAGCQAGSAEPPVSFAIVDLDVDGSPAAFARLEAIAKAGEAFTVPVLVNGTAKLLGITELSAVDKLDNKAALFQAPHQAPWRSIAGRPSLRWVTIAMNGVLARPPYDKATSRVREAIVKEVPDDEGAWVWMRPAWVVGTLAVASFRETGWPCRIVGPRHGVVGDLPVRELHSNYEGEDGVAVPTEVFVSTESQRDLAKSGVLLVASAPNSDAAYVLTAPTAYVTPEKRTYDSATTEPEARLPPVSLVDQLFVARLVQFLRALSSKLPSSSDPAEAQPVLEAATWALFENGAPAGPQLELRVRATDEGALCAVTVRPRRFLGVTLEELSLELPLG